MYVGLVLWTVFRLEKKLNRIDNNVLVAAQNKVREIDKWDVRSFVGKHNKEQADSICDHIMRFLGPTWNCKWEWEKEQNSVMTFFIFKDGDDPIKQGTIMQGLTSDGEAVRASEIIFDMIHIFYETEYFNPITPFPEYPDEIKELKLLGK